MLQRTRLGSVATIVAGVILILLFSPIAKAKADDAHWTKRDPSCSCQSIASS
ncbi:MAG: hypothetical protein HY050_03795, partial [Actinobacteria bacterium]|nr:hypothetical protein [Actinomycetota bacterium]